MNKSEVDELLGDRYLWSVDGNNGRRYLQMNIVILGRVAMTLRLSADITLFR